MAEAQGRYEEANGGSGRVRRVLREGGRRSRTRADHRAPRQGHLPKVPPVDDPIEGALRRRCSSHERS
eukprot:13806609-Heterocapsa_arctica.AAC.1